MPPRKKKPSPSQGGPVFVMSYIHAKTGKRVESKTGKPFVFYPKKKAA